MLRCFSQFLTFSKSHFLLFSKSHFLRPFLLLFLSCTLFIPLSNAGPAKYLLDKGWSELTRDNDTAAMKYFFMAYDVANKGKDSEEMAVALLDLGICSYGVSYSDGLSYAMKAMEEYGRLEKASPEMALEGRSKCLQLISTIYSRQGNYRKSIALSKEALNGFLSSADTNGYKGLIYNSLGVAYGRIGIPDSSEYYHRLALQDRLAANKLIYLPGSYLRVADIERKHGNREQSRILYDRAWQIADSTGNRQSQVSALIGLGDWSLAFEKENISTADGYYGRAFNIAKQLSDKSFYLDALDHLVKLRMQMGLYRDALSYQQEMQMMKDSLFTWEKQKLAQHMEIQYQVAEKDRELKLAAQDRNIARLTNYILWGSIAMLLLVSVGTILFLKRINKRDKALLKTREELIVAIEEQKKLKLQQMQNDLEFKESQLSILAIKMFQKNQLVQELQDYVHEENGARKEDGLSRIITKATNQDSDWADFDKHFESVNKNFYSRLKMAYPDISPNDLKIAALTKLNLSIKEMAGILNISPDSVKTARYRLRKKLQLHSEDNLTDFILNLS